MQRCIFFFFFFFFFLFPLQLIETYDSVPHVFDKFAHTPAASIHNAVHGVHDFHKHTKSEGKHLDSRLWSCDPNIPGTERYICIKGGMGSRKGSIRKSGEEELRGELIILYIIIM